MSTTTTTEPTTTGRKVQEGRERTIITGHQVLLNGRQYLFDTAQDAQSFNKLWGGLYESRICGCLTNFRR